MPFIMWPMDLTGALMILAMAKRRVDLSRSGGEANEKNNKARVGMRWIIDISGKAEGSFCQALGIQVCVGHVDHCSLIFEELFSLCRTAPQIS